MVRVSGSEIFVDVVLWWQGGAEEFSCLFESSLSSCFASSIYQEKLMEQLLDAKLCVEVPTS